MPSVKNIPGATSKLERATREGAWEHSVPVFLNNKHPAYIPHGGEYQKRKRGDRPQQYVMPSFVNLKQNARLMTNLRKTYVTDLLTDGAVSHPIEGAIQEMEGPALREALKAAEATKRVLMKIFALFHAGGRFDYQRYNGKFIHGKSDKYVPFASLHYGLMMAIFGFPQESAEMAAGLYNMWEKGKDRTGKYSNSKCNQINMEHGYYVFEQHLLP